MDKLDEELYDSHYFSECDSEIVQLREISFRKNPTNIGVPLFKGYASLILDEDLEEVHYE